MKTLFTALILTFTVALGSVAAERIIDLSTESSEVKEITVASKGMTFTTEEIRVRKGDVIRLTFQNGGGTHDWVLDEFDAKTKVIRGGTSETIEFTADQAGTFEFYCSVANHRRMGMVGKFVVIEQGN
jgi:plastocyanin